MNRKTGGHVVVAWAEHCSGPGWNNQVVWYLWRDCGGRLTIECIQPGEQSASMWALFDVCAQASLSLTKAVGRLVEVHDAE